MKKPILNEMHQLFAKCNKEDCVCYQIEKYQDGSIHEFCYRDNISFERINKK